MVLGPSSRIESRSVSSKPRISEVMPTIDVMPMTTPRTVSAERILLVRSVSTDMPTISLSSPARIPAIYSRLIYSRLRASIGSRFAALIAGYIPKNRPTIAVMPMPMATDQTWTEAGSGVAVLIAIASRKPSRHPPCRRRSRA